MIPTILLLSLFGLPYAPIQTVGGKQTANAGLITAEQWETMAELRSAIVPSIDLATPYPHSCPYFLSTTLASPPKDPLLESPSQNWGLTFTLFDFDKALTFTPLFHLAFPKLDMESQEYLRERSIVLKALSSCQRRLAELQLLPTETIGVNTTSQTKDFEGSDSEPRNEIETALRALAISREDEPILDLANFGVLSLEIFPTSSRGNSGRLGPFSKCGLLRAHDLRLEDLIKPARSYVIGGDGCSDGSIAPDVVIAPNIVTGPRYDDLIFPSR
jgi:hypothetical protein